MRRIDLGGNPPPAMNDVSSAALDRVALAWLHDSAPCRLHIIARAQLTIGRHSSNDICVRLEPLEVAGNRDKTLLISGTHVVCRYLGTRVEIRDVGSANGTVADGRVVEGDQVARVGTGTPVVLAGVLELALEVVPRRPTLVDTGNVLSEAEARDGDDAWQQGNLVGANKPGDFDYVRVRRINNLPELQYVGLYHSAAIGYAQNCLILLPPRSTKSSPRVRVLDIGADVQTDPARILVMDGGLYVERMGRDPVCVDGSELPQSSPVPLKAPSLLSVGELSITVNLLPKGAPTA